MPIGFFIFTRCVPTHLDICLLWILSRVWYGHLLEGSTPFLRVLLSFNVSDIFGGGSEVFRKFSQSILRELAFLFPLISSGISALAYGYSIVLPLVRKRFFLGALDHPKILPDFWGFPKFLAKLLRNCDQRTSKFDYWLLFFLSQDEEYLFRLIPFSLTGFLVFFEEEKIKYR